MNIAPRIYPRVADESYNDINPDRDVPNLRWKWFYSFGWAAPPGLSGAMVVIRPRDESRDYSRLSLTGYRG